MVVTSGISVKGESGVDLSAHSSWNDLQDLNSEVHTELVHCVGELVGLITALALAVFDGIL